MSRWVWIGVGALMVVLGLIFTFQGLGLLAGSAMTGVTLWAVLGPIIALVGLAGVVIGARRAPRS